MAVIELKIGSRSAYADGASFGDAGSYEQIDGTMIFAVDPANAANEGIVDLDLAPRDAAGRVRFRSDFSLLTPADRSKGNRRLLLEVVNRGRRLMGMLNHAAALEGVPTGNDPGDGFLFRHGWTVASVGWQWDVVRQAGLVGFDAPPVLQDGLPVTGHNIVSIRPNYAERSFLLANRVHQAYPAVRIDDAEAHLYVRDHEDGDDTEIPRSQWRFARETADGGVTPSKEHVYLKDGFQPGKVYNLIYRAEGCRVVAAGLLALRDAASFLRRPSAQNPLGAIDHAYGYGVSQTGRLLRHFLYLGLNLDEEGRQAFDGLLVHVAGARRGEFNHRFAQPSVQLTPSFGNTFPYADDDAVDPYSERVDGLLRRQRAKGGVPKLFYTNTSAEYWRGDAALIHTDLVGEHDLEPNAETRIYHFAGTQHTPGSLPQKDRNPNEGTRGRHGFNLTDYAPLIRGALANLDAWVADGVEPPASTHPSVADGTLVAQPRALSALVGIPGLALPDPAQLWSVREMDLGPDAARGIGVFPAKTGRAYPRLVPAVGADGNEVSGICLPDLTVPVATNTGWNPRHPETGAPGQIISMMGSTRFFAPTRQAREQANDPRLSLEERYASRDAYLALVREAARRLVAQRYVLEEDLPMIEANAAQRYDAALAGE